MTAWQPGDPLYRQPVLTSQGVARPMFEVLDQPGMIDGLVLDRCVARFFDEPEDG